MTVRATINLKTKEIEADYSCDSLDELMIRIKRKYRTVQSVVFVISLGA